jgi:hypothetical protein
MSILCGTAFYDDKLSLFINVDNQNFNEHVITSHFLGASCCSAIDIDGDSDIDVLGTAWYDSEVAIWLKH